MEEDLRLVRYEISGGVECAIMRNIVTKEECAFNKASLETRLDNLKCAGQPYKNTVIALLGFS